MFVFILLFSQNSSADFNSTEQHFFTNETPSFVTVDNAFRFNAVQSGSQLSLDWQIAQGYYLYRKSITINGKDVHLNHITLPKGLTHLDEFFGTVDIYREALYLNIVMQNIQPHSTITIEYQGCADKGFCYPPEKKTINLTTTPLNITPQHHSQPRIVSEQNHIAAKLSEDHWTLLMMFFLGIGMAFTPCVLPMYPIVTSIVLGNATTRTKSKTALLSFIYVQGMAFTYTLLGLVVASAGVAFQAYLQNPYILTSLSLLFILLSLSMFGVFSLQLPSAIQTYLNRWSNRQKGGSLWGVFLMGIISGLVCSPCTTAPLSGALLFVSQTGDLYIGAIALYLLALGMGVPLIAVAVFGQQALPKSGLWMNKIKQFFGFVLLSAPLFLLERLLPDATSRFLWAILIITTFIWLLTTLQKMTIASGFKAFYRLIFTIGLLFSLNAILAPVWHQNHQRSSLPFISVTNITELTHQLALAKQAQKPVMIDFYADWCVACKEFEKYTFSDKGVQQALAHYNVIQIDVTANNSDDQALLNQLNILGLPTLQFWDSHGNTRSETRITGFMNSSVFLNHLLQLEKTK